MPVDSQALTPFGFRRFGDLKVDDLISGRDGEVQEVIGVYEQGVQDIYEVQFIDGAKAECTLDHLWLVKETWVDSRRDQRGVETDGQGHSWNVWTFQEIKEWLDEKPRASRHAAIKRQALSIPICDPIKFSLGSDDEGDAQCKVALISRRITMLEKMLEQCAHCVKEYSDFYVTDDGQLAKDIQWLVWSLGGLAKIWEHSQPTTGCSIQIVTPAKGGDLTRRIVGYRYVGKKEARCIAVSNPDSLYITNDFVVTHNTYGIGMLIAHRVQKYGKYLRALFLRRSNPELEDAIDQYQELFAPVASWVASRNTFHFHNGATLRMGFIDRVDDIKKYQGKQYALIAFDEVTNFSAFNIIERMRGSLRNARGIPTQMILSGNPGGPLHTRLKMDFIDPYPAGGVLIPDGFSKRMNRMTYRCFIPSRLSDNPYLADTGYEDELRKSGTPTQVRQWLDGVWDATENAAFADLFDASVHFMNPFVIPRSWKISKSYDYGSSAPWACVWFAVSDGSDYTLPNGQLRPTIKGDIFVIYELYGWNGRPNEGTKESIQSQAEKIKLVESSVFRGREMQISIADSAIFASLSNYCIADEFEQSGIAWQRCNKFPGSREHGFKLMRERLIASRERDNAPGIFWFRRCRNCIRTIPGLQMERDGTDKVMGGKGAEDHLYDAICYFLLEQSSGEAESGATNNY